jgi:hypothetical protein
MNLPPVIKNPEPPLLEEKVENRNEHLPIILILTKDLKKEDLVLLNSYGKVILYEQCYNNIEVKELDFLYLVLDLRKPDDRVYYQKHIVPIKDNVKEILYYHAFEDIDLDVDVKRTKLPVKQATLEMFNQLLFQSQLPKPRACLSFLQKCVTFTKG